MCPSPLYICWARARFSSNVTRTKSRPCEFGLFGFSGAGPETTTIGGNLWTRPRKAKKSKFTWSKLWNEIVDFVHVKLSENVLAPNIYTMGIGKSTNLSLFVFSISQITLSSHRLFYTKRVGSPIRKKQLFMIIDSLGGVLHPMWTICHPVSRWS